MIAAAMLVPPALLALGTFLPTVPYFSTVAMTVFPAAAGPFLAAIVAGTALAASAARRGAARTGWFLAALGMATATAAGFVLATHARIAAANGVSVNVLQAIVPRLSNAGAAPDDTRIYTGADGQDLALDVYRPAAADAAAPIVVHVHGGGWNSLDRTAKAANLRWFADRGFLGVSVDYALATRERATWRSAAPQVSCALAWIAAHARAFGGDPDRLFMFGESAGGALALTAAYSAASGDAVSSCGGRVPAVTAIAAMVPAVDPVSLYENPDPLQRGRAREMVRRYLGGSPLEYRDRATAVSSATYITSQAPPTLLFLSENDSLVPIEGALGLVARATQAGVAMRTVRFPWADHGVAVLHYSVVNQAWLQMMRRHFCEHGAGCR